MNFRGTFHIQTKTVMIAILFFKEEICIDINKKSISIEGKIKYSRGREEERDNVRFLETKSGPYEMGDGTVLLRPEKNDP